MTRPTPEPRPGPHGRILRARRVLTAPGQTIEDGAVELRDGVVARVGPWQDLRGTGLPVQDLGEAILLPGLVNGHCHLDYTLLAGLVPATRSFPDWIKAILATKAAWSDADFTSSWALGARQLIASGCTTVANIEAMPALVAGLRAATPLRVHSFVEITGVRSGRDPDALIASALGFLDAWAPPTGQGGVGLSPHAPYSTLPALLRILPDVARLRRCPVTMHVAESREEFDMFMYRRGAMHDWLHPQRPDDDCGHGSPVRHVARHGLLGPSFIAVHVNYLWHDDARLLGDSGSHVAHCPQSHAFFKHQRFPASELAAAGVNVCLGTDSLASTRVHGVPSPTLSMFDEMAAYLAHDSTVAPADVVAMATVNGARALGLGPGPGTIAEGGAADLCAIPDAPGTADAHEVVVAHVGETLGTWVGGERAWPPCPGAHDAGNEGRGRS